MDGSGNTIIKSIAVQNINIIKNQEINHKLRENILVPHIGSVGFSVIFLYNE